jgi:soluble lytic murein transglycosylase-like protein
MRHSKFFLALLLGFASAGGYADVFGYVDEQGVSHFAAEKLDARYQLLVRGNQFGTLDLDSAKSGRQQPPSRLIQHPNLKKYDPLLKRASTDYAVELALLKAVMAAESGFDPDAVSPKGAIGLMQVMPLTAERYGLLGDKNKSLEQKLRDPKTNIRLGARYLADLFKLFPRQPSLVLASYNAGEGAVQQHDNKIPPYPETHNYVQLVTQLYHVYRSSPGTRNYKAEGPNSPANGSKRMHLTIQPPRE